MAFDARKVIGTLKAAILARALGWDIISPIMTQLSKSEKDMIFKLQSKLEELPAGLVESVAKEFIERAELPKLIEEKKKKEKEKEAKKKKEELEKNKEIKMKAIQAIPPDSLIQLIQNEHPQTICLIIAHLQPSTASEVMGLLPDEIKADVAYRIANLDKVASGMLEEVDKVLEELLSNKDTSVTQKAGGVPRLSEILNMIDGTIAEQIIEEIEEDDPDMAEEIRQNMFVFDDLVLVDDKGLQKVLRSVEAQELAVALKASTDDVKEKIFRNMSERAAEILKEEMEVSGAIRIKEVTDAQQKITKIVQDMERKGELVIAGRGGEEFVG